MSTKHFPSLFKKSSTGAIVQWDIAVKGDTITVIHGQVDGKLQTTSDTIKSGKSIGKSNETDRADQALKEATSKWTKKKKSGYVEMISAARAGETDSLIEGGVLPMLAKGYEKYKSKITFPVAVQPKLDGHRCIAVFTVDGKVSLWSRTRKRIESVPHIVARLEGMASKFPLKRLGGLTLDGEIYSHAFKSDFEKLTSGARKVGGNEHSKKLQYHVYDMVSSDGYRERLSYLEDIIMGNGGSVVRLVETHFVNNPESISELYFAFKTSAGYEGLMVRSLDRGYENKRSDQLLKMKVADGEKREEAEFEIIGVEEGRGKLQGHVGAFICVVDGKEFNAKMAGATAKLKEYWENQGDYIGENLTVEFFGYTKRGIPKNPVAIRIRQDL